MAGLADFRKQHPEYEKVPDEDLSNALYTKYYAGAMPRDVFDTKMGMTPVRESSVSQQLHNRYVIPEPESKWNEFMVGLSRPVANIDRAVGGVTKNVMGLDTGSAERYSHYMRNVNDMQERGVIKEGSPAEIGGGIVGTAPVSLLTRNPFTNSAISGALESEGKNVKQVGTDALWAGTAGLATHGAMRATGAAIAPHVNPMAKYLLDKGVKLTPGQIVGGKVHDVESAVNSMAVPFVSDAYDRSIRSFNTAVANDALDPLGLKVPTRVKPGHDTVEFVQKSMDDAYDQTIPKLTLSKDIPWRQDIQQIAQDARGLTKEHRKKLVQIGTLINNKFDQNGQMSGEALKDMEETLRGHINRYSKGLPADKDYADLLGEVRFSLRDLASRSNPVEAAKLAKINAGYAQLARMETAAANTAEGVFTPSGYRRAVVAMDQSVRKRASAAGNALGQDLATAGETVLPNTIPDSGTPFRHAVQLGTGAALYGGTGFLTGMNPLGLGAVTAALLPYTKTGGALVRGALTKRPKFAPYVRRGTDALTPSAVKIESLAEIGHRNDNRPEE